MNNRFFSMWNEFWSSISVWVGNIIFVLLVLAILAFGAYLLSLLWERIQHYRLVMDNLRLKKQMSELEDRIYNEIAIILKTQEIEIDHRYIASRAKVVCSYQIGAQDWIRIGESFWNSLELVVLWNKPEIRKVLREKLIFHGSNIDLALYETYHSLDHELKEWWDHELNLAVKERFGEHPVYKYITDCSNLYWHGTLVPCRT